MAQKIIDNKRIVTTTTNATITTLMTVPIPTNSAMGGMVKITVKDTTTHTNAAFYVRQVLAVNNAGTTSIIGTVSAIGVDMVAAGLVTALVTLNVTGTDLLIRGTGIAATTLEWQVDAYFNIN